ncbi:MAG TPA: hypothetical protein VGQ75_10235 [Thermoanaerobaculia bacterium]|jgi:hypothetical protein|nr:hypothetical protein [Thermoanaerobaculia bacterium]HEV8608837.1 hypothetical protein [Thermoanaerobaculia bacterium]
MKRVLLVLLALVAIACRERGRPDPSIRMAVSHDRETEDGGSELGGSVPTTLVVPPEVTAAYSGVRIAWKDSQTGREGAVDVPIGGSAKIPDSDLEIRTDVFLPSFSMSSEEITSTGIGQENPAARIAVVEGGKEVFAGWIFKRFPDVHPFQHPRFSLRLEGGVPRKTA